MTEREALLRAVCENPNDDLPRLVFADWFDENGDPDRGTFVRAQVEFARHWRAGEGLNALAREQFREMWHAHETRWRKELPVLPGVLWDVVFHRGFIERVSVDSDAVLVRHADAILGQTPVLHLNVKSFAGVKGFATLEPLRHLKTCTLHFTPDADDRAAEALLACTAFREDLTLCLHPGPPTRAQAVASKFGDRWFRPRYAPPRQAPPSTTTRPRRRRSD
jgi:uncharacterized protein (TIGR02996 family)